MAYLVDWPRDERPPSAIVSRCLDIIPQIGKAYAHVYWRSEFLKDLRSARRASGRTVSLSELLSASFSQNKRSDLIHECDVYAKRVASSRFRVVFPHEVPGGALREVFLAGMYFAFPDFRPTLGSTVVDVGAQYGDYSLICARLFGARVFAFEPEAEAYGFLLETIKLNRVDAIEAFNFALGSDQTEGLPIEETDRPASRVRGGGKHQGFRVASLDSVVDRKIDLVKIDTDGMEMDVLQGSNEALSRWHPKIIIEVHSIALKRHVVEYLAGLGYSLKHSGRVTYAAKSNLDVVQNLYFG